MRHSTRNLQHTVLEGKHKRRSRERRPAVEGLEERALLSAAHDLAVHKHFAVPDAQARQRLQDNQPGVEHPTITYGPDHRPEPGQPLGHKLSTGHPQSILRCGSPTKVRA